MMKLLKTIKNIFSAKCRKINRKMQVENCIDLIDEHQLSLAEAYKKIAKAIANLEYKQKEIQDAIETESKPEIKTIKQKNAEIIASTLVRLNKNKDIIANKLKKSEDSKDILIAKKSLLESIESIKDVSSNMFENQDFDVDAIMKEIDTSIQEIEVDLQSNDELNGLIKG